jgi:hypothetical protein
MKDYKLTTPEDVHDRDCARERYKRKVDTVKAPELDRVTFLRNHCQALSSAYNVHDRNSSK